MKYLAGFMKYIDEKYVLDIMIVIYIIIKILLNS